MYQLERIRIYYGYGKTDNVELIASGCYDSLKHKANVLRLKCGKAFEEKFRIVEMKNGEIIDIPYIRLYDDKPYFRCLK